MAWCCGPELSEEIGYAIAKAAYYNVPELLSQTPQFSVEQGNLGIFADHEWRDAQWFSPFHPGLVKYLEEEGIWDEEWEAWNQKRLDEEAQRIATWEANLK